MTYENKDICTVRILYLRTIIKENYPSNINIFSHVFESLGFKQGELSNRELFNWKFNL